VDAMHAF